MRTRPFFLLGLCFAASAALGVVYAQSGGQNAKKPARKVPAAPRETDNGAVIVTGDKSINDGVTDTSKLTGNVSVSQVGEDFILYAQSLVYSKPQNRAVATEKLRVVTRDSTIRGARIDADFNTKILTMTGDVAIATHGKGDGITGNRAGNLRAEYGSKPSKLFCDRVDWDYETRQATLTGNIRMRQGKNNGTCDRIEYDEPQNVVRLMGSVRFTDEKGQVYATPDLTVYNNENRIVTGRSKLKIKPNAATSSSPQPTKAPAPPKKAPTISDADLQPFGVKPAPIPTLKPEPTPVPQPEPAPEPESEAAPGTPDAAIPGSEKKPG